jgi:anthranilate synthase component II
MKVLLIDNFDSFTYNLAQLVEETALCSIAVAPYDQVDETIIATYDKIIISPGPGIPDDFPKLEQFIHRFSRSKSFLGVCLGHQVIGVTFGAELVNLGQVFHGVTKTTEILQPDHYLFQGIPDHFRAGLYHSWALREVNLTFGLDVLARASDGIIMAIAHKQYDLVGVQFHPESFMTSHGGQIIRNWLMR